MALIKKVFMPYTFVQQVC